MRWELMRWGLIRVGASFTVWVLMCWVALGPLRGPISRIRVGDTSLDQWLATTGLVVSFVLIVLGLIIWVLTKAGQQSHRQ